MSVFSEYAQYYDLLYRDKDYPGEVAYVDSLIKQRHGTARSLLDLGCGSGRHAGFFAEHGYQVTGVDLSEPMLEAARSNLTNDEIAFHQGDVRSVRLQQRFDVVVSLFHVMCYVTTNEDLKAALTTVAEHLKPNGLFIFDLWYGPAVLHQAPEVRVKRVDDPQVEVTRIANPRMFVNDNCVEVNYHLFVRDRKTGHIEEFTENHRVRYLFLPELDELLASAGVKLNFAYEWMSDREPTIDSWSVCLGATVVG